MKENTFFFSNKYVKYALITTGTCEQKSLTRFYKDTFKKNVTSFAKF